MAPAIEPAASPGAIRGFCVSAAWQGARVYLRPLGLLGHADARRALEQGGALPLAGGPFAFLAAELALRAGGQAARAVAPLPEILAWAAATGRDEAVAARLDALTAPRAAFAGLPMDRPSLMGIVNVTPDSFSDGGHWFDHDRAIAHGTALLEAGADLLDIGGESTRPGSQPVDPEEETRRILPVIRHFAERGALVSVDTRHARVMAAALEAGARIVNDVTALTGDPDALAVVRQAGVPVMLMHMQGDPQTMQKNPHYDDAALDIYDWLSARVAACREAGLPLSGIAVDYGIGFGKTLAHNLELLRATALFHGLRAPLVIGVSRKGFIAKLSRGEPPAASAPGSIAAGLAALDQGAQILRVHDVAETFQARAVWQALAR